MPHKSVCTKSKGWALRRVCDFGNAAISMEETSMKIWSKPAVREQEVGLEVTSYLPAEIDVI